MSTEYRGLSYVVYSPAHTPYDFQQERFEVYGADAEDVREALVDVDAAQALGSVAITRNHAYFADRLVNHNRIDASDGYRLLPDAMNDGKVAGLIGRRFNELSDRHLAGSLTTKAFVDALKQGERYGDVLHGDTLRFVDANGRFMRWNDEGEIELDVDEGRITYFDDGSRSHADDARQLAAMALTHYHFQIELDGNEPSVTGNEHVTHGYMDAQGNFIPVVTTLEWDKFMVAEDLAEDSAT